MPDDDEGGLSRPASSSDRSRSRSGPSAGQRERDRRQRLRRIVDAAVVLAEEGGLEGVRSREICARADVSMGTLYRIFESKEDILLYAFAEDFAELERAFGLRGARGGSPAERAERFFRGATEAFATRPLYAKAVIAALASGQSKAVSRVAALTSRIIHLIKAVLVGRPLHLDAGALDDAGALSDARALEAARILHRVWFSLLVGWAAEIYPTEDVVREMRATVDFLLVPGERAPK